MTSKKVVLKLHINDNKEKQKALKAVSSISGLESVAMDMKEQKLTAVGAVDPVEIVGKLRKFWRTDILTVGPAKEPEKKREPEPDSKKPDDGKKAAEDAKKKEIEQIAKTYPNYNFAPYYPPPHYRVYSAEENPNSCVIC